MKLQVRVKSAPWKAKLDVLIRSISGDSMAVAQPLVMTTIDPELEIEPTFSLTIESAQALMDDLWDAGIRPTEGTGSAGAMAATQKHLEDMRTLVFQKPA